MSDPDKQAFQERLDRMAAIFSGIVAHAEEQSLTRCPYRNRFDLCTALFRCRNQLPVADGDPDDLACGHDGKFDYRTAWESNPRAVKKTRERIVRIRRDAERRRRDRRGSADGP
jgi:hypothetical protein